MSLVQTWRSVACSRSSSLSLPAPSIGASARNLSAASGNAGRLRFAWTSAMPLLVQILLNRCWSYMEPPPPDSWDGITNLTK